MKKIIFVSLILLLTFSTNAQEQEEVKQPKNEIGIDLIDLVDATLQISYERMLGKHISVNLGLGYKTEEGLINLSGIDRDQIKTGGLTYSGFKVVPEVRYYLNAKEDYKMNGFYFGAYLKYSNLSSDLDGIYIDTNDNDREYILEFDADLNVTSVGFMIGYKLPVWKNLSLDFLIAGPGAGFYNFSIKNSRDDTPPEFYEDLNEALENYSFFDFLNSDFKFSDINNKTSFGIPSFRYGISLGYSF